jgi:hypothetical protein
VKPPVGSMVSFAHYKALKAERDRLAARCELLEKLLQKDERGKPIMKTATCPDCSRTYPTRFYSYCHPCKHAEATKGVLSIIRNRNKQIREVA